MTNRRQVIALENAHSRKAVLNIKMRGRIMPEGIPRAFPLDVTRKWRALAQRRKAHLVDLYNSGRWRFYYTEPEYLERLREAVRVVDQWRATEQAALDGITAEVGAGEGVGEAAGAVGEATAVFRNDSPPIDGSGDEGPSLVDVAEQAGCSAQTEFSCAIDAGSCADPGAFADEWTPQSETA